MSESYIPKIAYELKLTPKRVRAGVELLDGGGTVPFIARYRKEVTGSLDEVELTSIRDRIGQLRELDKRRAAILSSLEERKKLTKELKDKILAAETLTVLEDIYLPYRPKRRTRATVAKEKGLEPLAEMLFKQEPGTDPLKEAVKFVDAEKKVESADDALAGARDIIAEWISEDADLRAKLRKLYFDRGKFRSRVIAGKQAEGANYKDYFEWQDDVRSSPSHRVLAVRRAEKEKIVSLRVLVPEEEALEIMTAHVLKAKNPAADQVRQAMEDGYRRLLSTAMETEVRTTTKEAADRQAIHVFAQNLRQLLMAAPLGHHNVMAIDPAYRTGCKVVCINPQGKFLENRTIFPVGSAAQQEEGRKVLREMAERHKVEFVAIGNGTASRETEEFVRAAGLPEDIQVLVISEAGASVYSASDAARREFPDFDVTVRGAISIGRRLQDPLAELVKIDPKSIGVGQYQHDVDQGLLRRGLDDVVISCVNQVGVELNTASRELLTYVSGLGPTRAQAIVDHRNARGPFTALADLAQVERLGPKAIEQAAGFLRLHDGKYILDSSAVHPESYPIVERMAANLGCAVRDLIRDGDLRSQIKLEDYASAGIGMPTLNDIYEELARPGRDPRDKFEIFRFKEGVERPEDLVPGMKLPGIVTNITKFGAFVDVGVHLDGLLHISQLSEGYVRNVTDVVKVHQKVEVTVIELDLKRKRIALSMKKNPEISMISSQK